MVRRDKAIGAWFKNSAKQADPRLVVHAFLSLGVMVKPFQDRRGGGGQSKRQGTHGLRQKGKGRTGRKEGGELEVEVVLVVVGLLLGWHGQGLQQVGKLVLLLVLLVTFDVRLMVLLSLLM
jgi:hypothetical protein